MAIEKNTAKTTLKKAISPNNPNQTENQGGRPSKLEKFLEAMEKIVNDGINSIIMTDEELFILANDLLEEKDQISYTTFKNYKGSRSQEETKAHNRFLSIYKKALTNQKKTLFANMTTNDPQWQKYAWIIERKFSDWNLRSIQEVNQKTTSVNYNKDVSELTDEELEEIIKGKE